MTDHIAVLSSGGLDSCVLIADMARQAKVIPIYIQNGLFWEKEELKALEKFIQALHNPNIEPIINLHLPIQSLYEKHWSMIGKFMPDKNSSDTKTYIPGRNILLLSLAAVWCSMHHVPRIAIGSLLENPFLDSTPDFFNQLSQTLSSGLAFQVHIEAPYREKYKKNDLIQKFHTLPLELSMSCMNPKNGMHCGQCNKCIERQMGYKNAKIPDQTKYATTQG